MPRITVPTRRMNPGNVLPMTPVQYGIMRRWADGDFINDLSQPVPMIELLPDTLDRVAVSSPAWAALSIQELKLVDLS